MQNVGLKILIIYPWPWFGGVCVQHMNSISQQVNLLVPCHSICSYLTLSNQLELLFFQRCLLIIVFSISQEKIDCLKAIYIRSLTTISHCAPCFFKCSKQKSSVWTWLVKIQSWRIHSRLLHSRLASHFRTITLMYHPKTFLTSWIMYFTSMHHLKISRYTLKFYD